MITKTRTVYHEVGSLDEVCAYGDTHVVTYHETKKITATGETREFDDGYNIDQTPLYTDKQGRIYHLQPIFDSGRPTFERDDGKHFDGQPGRYRRSVRDLMGKPLNDTTPAGPAWDDLESIDKPTPSHLVKRKRKS